MTALPLRCEACHRPVVRGPVLWDAGTPYGPRCGRARGLDGGRRVRARRPERTGDEQPVLFDLDEINDESEEPMNYIHEAIAAVNAELPGEDPELIRLYALLALTIGVETTLRDVHDAWAVWRDRTVPDHRSIIPFDELSVSTQELDEPYAEGIRRAARKLEADRG